MDLTVLDLNLFITRSHSERSGIRLLEGGLFSNQYVKTYNDPINQRNLIRMENNGKIGVYAWYNKINGKIYIGSGDPLYIRISDYYQKWYLEKRSHLYIVRALNKYGLHNFSLYILEYTNPDNLISTEQNLIDLLKPEYNLNPIAGNSKGYKHTLDTIEKMRNKAFGRKHTEETKKIMSISRKGEKNSFYGKTHTLESRLLMKKNALNRINPSNPGMEVEITDLFSRKTEVFSSIRKAANSINSDIKTILRREKLQIFKGINTPYREKYLITINRN